MCPPARREREAGVMSRLRLECRWVELGSEQKIMTQDIRTRLRLMIDGVESVQDKNVPLHAGALLSLLRDCDALLAEATLTLEMVDTNNRVQAGERHRAWNGDFVVARVRELLTALGSARRPSPAGLHSDSPT